MAKIGLSFYSIRVTAPVSLKGKDKYEYVPLDEIRGRTISDWVYDFLLNKAKSYQKDLDKEKLYRPYNMETSEYMINKDYYFSSICGIVKSGDYGVEVEIVDSDTKQKVFNQTKEQAGVLPFGFALYYSKGISTGVLVTQSYGNKGMSNHFKKIVSDAIEENCDKHKVIIKSVFPNDYFRRLIDNEQIKDICIETYKKKNMGDKDEAFKNNEIIDYSTREIKYKQPVLKDKNKIYNIITQRRPLSEMKGLTNDDEEIKNMKVDFTVNGISKTVNYDTYFSLRISEDITNEVSINEKTGHPMSLSLFKQMDKYVLMYLLSMDIISEVDDMDNYYKIWMRHCHIKINDNVSEEVIDKRNERGVITV